MARQVVALWACFSVGTSCHAQTAPSHQAWFYSDVTLETESGAPETWCAFLSEDGAKAAAKSERFTSAESGWLQYRGHAITKLVVFSESEDAYVEDTYTFGPNLTVKEVVRRGHYYSDPFVSARFRPDRKGHLKITPESQRALQSWKHTTYFFEWPLYTKFSQLPFAGLVKLKPRITVTNGCHTVRR